MKSCLIKPSKNHPSLFMLSDKVPYCFFLLNLFIVKHITFIKKRTQNKYYKMNIYINTVQIKK